MFLFISNRALIAAAPRTTITANFSNTRALRSRQRSARQNRLEVSGNQFNSVRLQSLCDACSASVATLRLDGIVQLAAFNSQQ